MLCIPRGIHAAYPTLHYVYLRVVGVDGQQPDFMDFITVPLSQELKKQVSPNQTGQIYEDLS